MDTSTTFRAIITAVDKATPVLERIGAKIKMVGREAELAGNPWGPAAEKVSLFTRATNVAHRATARLASIGRPFKEAREPVHRLAEEVKHLGERFKWVGEKATELLPMLGALGGAASIAGVFELVHRATESFTELARGAEKIGITTAAMRQMSYIAEMTDTPVVALDSGLFRLNRTIADATAGKNKDAAALFAHLGIATRDASHHLRGAADVMPELQKAFRNTTDPAMRASMAMMLFSRQGRELLPFLLAAPDDMRKWSDEASRMVYTFSKDDGENLESFRIGWINLETAVGGFLDEVGSKLAPILTPLVNKFADWVAANRDWVATDIGGAVQKLASAVMRLDFDQVAKDTKAWFKSAGDLLDKIGGLKSVIVAIILLMTGKFVSAAVGVTRAMWNITAGAVGASRAIAVGLVASINSAERAMSAFNAVALKNPLVRAVVIADAVYENVKSTAADSLLGTQGQLNQADPAKLAAAGYKRNAAGKWELNGVERPEAPPVKNWFDHMLRRMGGWGGDHASDAEDGAALAGFDPTTGAVLPPSVFQQVRAAVAGAGQSGKVAVTVDINGAPPGTTGHATGSGIAGEPHVDVGYAFPGFAFAP
jgi:hypothetical protein